MRGLIVTLLGCLLLAGCAGSMQMGPSLEEVTQGFSEAMRWGDFPNAAVFIDPAVRGDFEDKFGEDDDLRVVDSRIMSINLLPDGKRAEVTYQLEYYHLPSSRIKKWRWKQRWEMEGKEAADPGVWLIKNGPPEIPWQKLKSTGKA